MGIQNIQVLMVDLEVRLVGVLVNYLFELLVGAACCQLSAACCLLPA